MTEDVLGKTVKWFEEARPKVTTKQLYTQMGVHFEEIGEMLECIDPMSGETAELLDNAEDAIKALAAHFKSDPEVRVNIAKLRETLMMDSLLDQIVTATGIGHHLGFPMVEGLAEVNASNYSKFDNNGKAISDPHGKIMKGPNYYKPDLAWVLSKHQNDLFT